METEFTLYDGDYEALVVEPREHTVMGKLQAFGRKSRLPDLDTIPGSARCAAHGLIRGGCYMQHETEDVYCYYHRKVADGLLKPDLTAYPVWPLPKWGYRFVSDE